MTCVLIDTSVWIEYFRGSHSIDAGLLNGFIENNQICTNDLILAELIPSLKIKNESDLIEALMAVRTNPIVIDWKEIIDFQTINMKNGINNVGIPDLILLQHVIRHNLSLATIDKHFTLMSGHFDFHLVEIRMR
jgi:predicted nucleic acid-binding protein